jgi:hypothetical protein
MSALWQSFAVAYRLSTIYRVAVAFMTPSQPAGTPKPNPTKIGIAVAPAPASLALTPQLYGPLQRVAFTLPPPPGSNPDDVTMTTAPLALAGGVTVVLGGQGLAPNPPLEILLTALDGTGTWKITGWQTAPATDSTMTLTPPTTYAIGAAPAPPASTPRPGLYLISVSDGATASPAVPVTIVPIFTNVTSPAILTLSGGAYKFTGAGFVPGATQLFAGGQQLEASAVTISLAGDSVSFTLPATQPPGTFPLRVRVDGVDAPATWQVAA